MFGASALYHRIDWSPRPRAWLRRLDHSMIYVLVAGTYTPFALLVLEPALGIGHFFGVMPEEMSARSRLIMTYALCGFANFGSLGILIGGMGAMVPERRPEIVALGLRSILSGTLATCMSGAVVSLLL